MLKASNPSLRPSSYEVCIHTTYTINKTIVAMEKVDHAIVIIAIMTNEAKFNKPVRSTHSKLLMMITKLKTQTHPDNIVVLEAVPSLPFDIFSYNRASWNLCKKMGVRMSPTLVGELHLWRDGIHVRHNCRHLLVKSVAAAIVGVDPRRLFGLERPPLGPFGPWEYPVGHPRRPAPSRFWPPIDNLFRPLPMSANSQRNYCNVAAAAPYYFRGSRPNF